jgi:hypothetical protein
MNPTNTTLATLTTPIPQPYRKWHFLYTGGKRVVSVPTVERVTHATQSMKVGTR